MWISAIRQEEALASVNHSLAEIDQWEAAHFKEDELRKKVEECGMPAEAKKECERELKRLARYRGAQI